MRPTSLVVLSLCAWNLLSSDVQVASLEAQSQAPTITKHVKWVHNSLIRMQSVKPGMTRADLLQAFTTEGGLSTRRRRTYVYRECPYFKVDVEFETVGKPSRDDNGPIGANESGRDIIKNISRPYLAFTVAD